MKRLKYPKVGGRKKQKNKRIERRKVKWKDTKNKEIHRAGNKHGPREAEKTYRREKSKMKSRNSRKEARTRKR